MRNQAFFNKIGRGTSPRKRRWTDFAATEDSQDGLLFGNSEGATALADPEFAENQINPQAHGSLISADLKLPGRFYLAPKRVFDITVSLFALAVFGFFLPLIALIIKLDSPGPVFYSQERVGINRRTRHRRKPNRSDNDRRKVLQPGKPFTVYKLRSMRTDAEAKGAQLAQENDSRITRVGNFLRQTRIDELPQFLNVLRGEMSLIGPRPERLVFVRKLELDIPDFRDRLLVKPGITGLAQVINGYDDGVESARRKVELDKRYINNSGWLQDLRILWSTVGVVIKGEGAR